MVRAMRPAAARALPSRSAPAAPPARGLSLVRGFAPPSFRSISRGAPPSRRPEDRHPDDRGEREGTGDTERAALATSASLRAPTPLLRQALRGAGADAAIVEAPRRVLVQALGLSAAARLSGQSPADVARLASLSPAAIAAAGLDRPDPLLVLPMRGRPRWGGAAMAGWYGTGLGEAEDGSGSASAPPNPATTPGAVPYRSGNWSQDFKQYTIAFGDTMWGLSTTYLGIGSRWMEIWSLQSFRYTKSPDPASQAHAKLQGQDRPMPKPGDVLQMPPEAQEKARRWARSPDVPDAPATPGAPGYGNDRPGQPDDPDDDGPLQQGRTWLEEHKTLVIVAGVAAVGAGAALLL